mmetsp:Transcript_14332/g.24398  ORF Transcript_14332/g.24398 Transcript_14332/m.24398 type:complete len:87 (+) Transcript_14332:433-693(+)
MISRGSFHKVSREGPKDRPEEEEKQPMPLERRSSINNVLNEDYCLEEVKQDSNLFSQKQPPPIKLDNILSSCSSQENRSSLNEQEA